MLQNAYEKAVDRDLQSSNHLKKMATLNLPSNEDMFHDTDEDIELKLKQIVLRIKDVIKK